MIEFAYQSDFSQIISLWHEVFGDSESFIQKYLERFFKQVLVYREEGEISGMLSLLPISVKKRTGFYVYAVATNPRYRSKGIASKLLEYSKKLCKNDEFLILVPASDSLFDFYKRFGFSPINSVIKKQAAASYASDFHFSVTPISPTELLILRKEYFQSNSFFEWDIDVLNLIHDVFRAKFLKFENNKGFAVCDVFENTVSVKELCCDTKDINTALSSIHNYFGMDIYSFVVPEKNGAKSAMVYNADFKNPYFNLALD